MAGLEEHRLSLDAAKTRTEQALTALKKIDLRTLEPKLRHEVRSLREAADEHVRHLSNLLKRSR